MRVRFGSRLVVESVDDEVWRVAEPFYFAVEGLPGAGMVTHLTVPTGTYTDFASVPRLPLIYLAAGGIGERAAVIHDWMYGRATWPRLDCDRVLLAALEADGVGWCRRQAMYWAVRLFGAGAYGRRREQE